MQRTKNQFSNKLVLLCEQIVSQLKWGFILFVDLFKILQFRKLKTKNCESNAMQKNRISVFVKLSVDASNKKPKRMQKYNSDRSFCFSIRFIFGLSRTFFLFQFFLPFVVSAFVFQSIRMLSACLCACVLNENMEPTNTLKYTLFIMLPFLCNTFSLSLTVIFKILVSIFSFPVPLFVFLFIFFNFFLFVCCC